jgi:inosine-uridine nucleoside N-ribohydrolase
MLRIWIDTDNALGSARGDVDDGFALSAVLAAASLSPNLIHIEGISAVAGNTDHATAFDCTSLLLQYFAHLNLLPTPQDLAPTRIANLRDGRNPIQLLALGPLTNVARAFSINPALAGYARVHWVGGDRHSYHLRRRLSDLNVARDRKSAAMVKTLAMQTQYPLDVIDTLKADASKLEHLGNLSPLGRFLEAHSKRWLRRAYLTHLRRSFLVWDLVPALHVFGDSM